MEENIIAVELADLPQKELAAIFKQGAVLRLPYLEGRLMKAEREIQLFKKKYKTSIAKLKSLGLPENGNHEMHEDFIEWEYWDDVFAETRETINQIKKLSEQL